MSTVILNPLEEAKVAAFADRLVGILNSGALSLMIAFMKSWQKRVGKRWSRR